MTTTPAGHTLGLIPDTPDNRDRLYAAPPPHQTPYQFIDLEPDPATPPVWDQGTIGSCTAHGSLAGFLWASNKAGVGDPMLSRLQVYYDARALEGTTGADAGAMIRDAIKATARGVAPEDLWPYDVAKFDQQPPSSVVAAAADNVALTYQRVGTDATSIQACLSEGFPVVIGVTLYESFEAPGALSSGVVPMPDTATERVLGGHCMAVWGIGTGVDWKAHGQFPNAEDSTLYVKLRNSWGSGVYVNGYLLIPIDYLAEYGNDFWTIRTVS